MKIQDFQNYANAENGCEIQDFSSENINGEANNVLRSIRKKVWMTTQPPPQSIILNLTNLDQYPKECYNIFGVDCWYDYQTNPKQIELFSSVDGRKFESEGKFLCKQETNWQIFNTKQISIKNKYLKLTILSNYGDDTTYLNQILLSYRPPKLTDIDKYLPTKQMMAEKSHLKLTSTEKELRKLQERMGYLQQQNERLKSANKVLNNRVFSMEQNMKHLMLQIKNLKRGALSDSQDSFQQKPKLKVKAKHAEKINGLPKVPRMSSNKHSANAKIRNNSSSSDSKLSNYEIGRIQPQYKQQKIESLRQQLFQKMMQKSNLEKKINNSRSVKRGSSDYQRF